MVGRWLASMELTPIRAAQAALTLTFNPHVSKAIPNLGGSEESSGSPNHFWLAVRLGVVPLSRAVTTI